MNKQDFTNRLSEVGIAVHKQLDSILDPQSSTIPNTLLLAMRHGLLNGGKRLRPFLVIESAALFGVPQATAMQTACALECLHSYSLIHDDLPAMDDDDLRRGQPTVHKAFDEATAILAGDALLTLSFELITHEQSHPSSKVRCELAQLLARASGAEGMIGGQMLDIAAETTAPNEAGIRKLQALKTGALIRFSTEAGAALGEAEPTERKSLIEYGKIIGLAFQLADDLLDVTSTAKMMGKAVDKDAEKGKATLVALHGVQKVETMLDQLVEQAQDCLTEFGNSAATLRQTALYVAQRKN